MKTRIYLKIKGVLKGKRKSATQLIHVADIEDSKGILPDMVVEYERIAWVRAVEQLSKFKNSGALNFHKIENIGHIERVDLMPYKSTLVFSDLGTVAI